MSKTEFGRLVKDLPESSLLVLDEAHFEFAKLEATNPDVRE